MGYYISAFLSADDTVMTESLENVLKVLFTYYLRGARHKKVHKEIEYSNVSVVFSDTKGMQTNSKRNGSAHDQSLAYTEYQHSYRHPSIQRYSHA